MTDPSHRALRIASVFRWLLLGAVSIAAAYSVWQLWSPDAHHSATSQADRYYCPMHPEIRSSSPGECPICHMFLEPISSERLGVSTSAHDAGATVERAPSTVMISLERQQAIGVVVSTVAKRSLSPDLRAAASIEIPTGNRAEVRTRSEGFIERIAVRETGVAVRRGQPLAWIYSPAIYRAQEEFLAAQQWSDSTSDVGIHAAATRNLELLGMTQADVATLVRTRTPQRTIALRAPISGYVTRLAAVLGGQASPEDALYEISDLSEMWIVARVDDSAVSRLRVGMQAEFRLDGATQSVLASVVLIEPDVSSTTRQTRIRLVAGNDNQALRPGAFGEVHFALPPADGLFVPRDAVIETGERAYVFVSQTDNRFEPRIVQLGPRGQSEARELDPRARNLNEEYVEIRVGVSEGEKIVTRGGFMLDSESRLQSALGSSAPTVSTHDH